MDDDRVFDRLTEIDMSGSTRKAEEFEALALSLPVGEYGRASFLIAAGQHRQMRGEDDDARRCFDLAVEDGGETSTDPLASLLGLALETGDEATVQSLSSELRRLVRDDRMNTGGCLFVGDTFRDHGRLREALRWFTIPLTYADLEDDDLDYFCLAGRYRTRRDLGLPEDRLDQIAAVEIELQRQRAD